MIRLTDINGRSYYVEPAHIVRITEAGVSCQWHGIRSFVRTSDGETLEVCETAKSIAALIKNEEHAARYEWLRSRDLNAINLGGVFAGMTPENLVLNGADLDAAIDAERLEARHG